METNPTLFRHAIVRTPAATFADGLTSVALGKPSLDRVLQQHDAYCKALRDCGLQVETLESDPRYPDSTFVEDAAVLLPDRAVLTRPGAVSRAGEVAEIEGPLRAHFSQVDRIVAPGTVDGGDICEADGHVYIGISKRTNEEGARQLAALLFASGFTSSRVDIRDLTTILHLKSGLSYLGDGTLVAIDELLTRVDLRGNAVVRVSREEDYAANCVRVNDKVLFPAGNPQLENELARRGFHPISLDMTEFRKMDGGLSCLSLRF